MTKKGGSKVAPMELQVSRSTGVIVMTDEEIKKQEDMYTVFGTKKRNKDGSPMVEKLLDVVGYVSQLESTQDETDASTRMHKVDSYRPERRSFANRRTHPEVDPALANIPQAYLRTIFANGRKQSDKIAREVEERSKLRDIRMDCSKCYKRSCRQHRNGKRHSNWRSTCSYCRVYPCDEHGSRSQWQQTDFPLCPHISMQLFWTVDDPTNSRDEWGFSITPVVGDKVEHEKCKGSIKGVQYNVDNLGAMVRERMDRMGLRGPPNVGRVIRNMPRFLQTPEVEINHEVQKKERDEDSWEEEQEGINEKKDDDTIRNGGLTIDLLEGDGGGKNLGKKTSKSEHKSSPEKKSKKPKPTSSSGKKKEAPTKEETPTKDETAKQKPTKEDKPSATANVKTTSKVESTKKMTEKKKVTLSEELIYDSDEGLSDVEQKEAEKVKEQERTLVSDNERPTRKTDMKRASKAEQNKVEENLPTKRKTSEVNDLSEAEADVQQPPTKKRKASEEGEISEDSEVADVEPEDPEENSPINHKASGVGEVADLEVEERSPVKRNASEAEDISKDKPRENEETMLFESEIVEVEMVSEIKPREVEEHSPAKRKTSEVEEVPEDKPRENEEQTPMEGKAPEANGVLADEPQEVDEKTLFESKTLEVEVVSENKPQEVEAASEDKPQGAEEHAPVKRKAPEVDDDDDDDDGQLLSKKQKATEESKREQA